jgi:predicted nuclease of predicted toxin-antitoxin system
VKLLIDEMWPPEFAVQLRRRGHDVVSVHERAELRGHSDPTVFAAAQAEGRAVVTENASDYRPIGALAIAHGRSHSGLIFTSDHRFPRHDTPTVGRVVVALDALVSSEAELDNREHWLT